MVYDEKTVIIDEEPDSGGGIHIEESLTIRENGKGGLFSKIDRELSESELHDSSLLKILINERDEYIKCKAKLEKCIDKCHQLDKQNAVLEGKLSSSTSNEILYSVMLALGPALLGLLPSLSGEKPWTYVGIGIVGLGLIAGAVWSKKVNK